MWEYNNKKRYKMDIFKYRKIRISVSINYFRKHFDFCVPLNIKDTSTIQKVFQTVLKKCGLPPESPVSICYIDEENDKVHIDSEAEYHEAVRVGQKCGNKLKIVVKEVGSDEQNTVQHSSGETFSYRELESGEFVVMDKLPCIQADSEPISDQSVRKKKSVEEEIEVLNGEESGIRSWLASYTVQLKDDLVKEVTDKVFERVMIALGNSSVNSMLEPEQKPTFIQETERNDSMLHVGIICDNCETPVRGIRYKCGNCKDYDLCEQCESLPHVHNEDHSFLKICHHFSKKTNDLSGSTENTIPKYSPSLRSFHSTKTSVIRNTLGLKNRKEEKIMKVMRKIEKYRAKEQSSNGSRTVPAVIWQQAHLDRNFDSRKTEYPSYMSASGHPSHNAQFIKDETIPDGTVVTPGLKFRKSWRIRNTGCKPFTSDTVLKHSWGGKELVPESKEVPVPSLLPGQEGVVSVVFTAPDEVGSCHSHWRLSHGGVGFGDRVWCVVEVEETSPTNKVNEHNSRESALKTHEKCTMKQNNVQDGIAEVLTAVQEEQQRGESVERKIAILSHTATPANTPFDLSPPKSPEPPQVSETSNCIKEEDNTVLCPCPELPSAQENYNTGSESDDTISVLNLNSSESDTEFVIVPMPLCCSVDVPLMSTSLQQEEHSVMPEACSAPSTRRASIEQVASPSSLPSICVCASKESNASSPSLSSNNPVSEYIGASEGTLSSCPMEGQNLILDQIVPSTENQREEASTLPPSEVQNRALHNGSCNTENESCCQNDTGTAEASNVWNENADNEERMVQVLPEGLVNGALTAAASVYNTARAVITGMQNRNEPCHEDRRQTPIYPSPPPPVPSLPLPMVQLIEMGFCNRTLNHYLLTKYNGQVEDVVAELVANYDNDWFNHRHSTNPHHVNFD